MSETTAKAPEPVKDANAKLDKSEKSKNVKDSKDSKETKPDVPEIKRRPVQATFRGWKETSGWTEADTLTAEDELDDLLSTPTMLENFLPDVAYGDWYHNVGILFLGGLLSWIFGHFKFSLGPIFFIILFTSLYYRTQVRKYRQVIKQNTQREMSVKRMETDYETMDWLNAMLDKYWIYAEPVICKMVADIVNNMIPAQITMLPAFIQAVWIDTITLGSKPFRVESVKTLPQTSDDVLIMDWCVSFTPNDYHDLTYKQLKNRVSQKVVVKIKVFGISIPIVVKNVAFKSTVRVRIHMMESFPHIDTINISLPELPMFDFVTKFFGDTMFNWEVMAFPGLWPFIYEMIQKYAGPLVIPPFSFQLNVEQLLAGDLNAAAGILAVTIDRAENVKLFDRTLDNTMDPYVTFGSGNTHVAKSTTLEDTKLPIWNQETLYVLVKNFADPLRMSIWDYNDDRKDGLIGIIDYDLQTLKADPIQKNVIAHFMRNNKPVGSLKFDLKYMPAILPKRLIDGSVEPPPELNTGIIRIEVGAAEFDVPTTAKAELWVNNKKLCESGLFKKATEANYGLTTRNVVTNRPLTQISLIIKDSAGKEINAIHTTLNDAVDRTLIKKPKFAFPDGSGEVSISAFWQPVKMDTVSGATTYSTPIGVVKVTVHSARDLRNLEKMGTIDPYVRVLLSGFVKARTTPKDSTTNPDWNEALFLPVTSVNQKLTIEAMDTETTSDRTLGSFDVNLSDVISRDDETGNLVEHVDKEPRSGRLVARKFSKGTVTYSLSFYPLQEILDPDAERAIEKESIKAKAREEKEKQLTDAEKKKAVELAKAQEELAKYDESVPLPKPVSDFSKTSKKRFSLEQAIDCEPGVFVYKILSTKVSQKDVYLQFFFDSGGYAEFESAKLSPNSRFQGTGDVFVKELNWSETTVRIVKEQHSNRAEDSEVSMTIPTLTLLKNSFGKQFELQIDSANSVVLQSYFIPTVAKELPPSDRIISSGKVSCEILNAKSLVAADSNGKSDPFVRLYLNGEEVYKTKTKKKTLDPEWNESCEFIVSNRFDAKLKVKVFDWDFGANQDDELGYYDLSLSEIDSEAPKTDIEVKLNDDNGIPNGGSVFLSFKFTPSYIVPVKKVDNNIGDSVLDGGKTFIAGGGKVIGGGIGAVGKVTSLFGKKKD